MLRLLYKNLWGMSRGIEINLFGYRNRLGTTVVVFEALDVVFAQLIAALDFDENQVHPTLIGDPVLGTGGDVNRFTNLHGNVPIVQGHHRIPLDDMPVFATALVALQ